MKTKPKMIMTKLKGDRLPNQGESLNDYVKRASPILQSDSKITNDKAVSICGDIFQSFKKSNGKTRPQFLNGFIHNTKWAILPSALESIIKIANRENAELKLNALLARDGEPLENSRKVSVRGNTAIVPINGPIFAKANLMTEISGATSTEILLKDFTTAMDDPNIANIIFDIDSEGGDVNGISDLADTIFSARNKKQIISFIRGTGASAAFWIATSSSKVFASKTSIIGSIGVISTFIDTSKRDEEEGFKEIEIVSSISPDKSIDPKTDKGKSQVQKIVDSLADIFAKGVAKNRGVDVKTVLNEFGKGGVFVGEEALQRNMIDEITTLEELIGDVSNESAGANFNQTLNLKAGANKMDLSQLTLEQLKAGNPELFEMIFALGNKAGTLEGITAENKRLQNIEKLVTNGNADIVNKIKFDTELSEGDVALAIVENDNQKTKAIGDNILNDGEELNHDVSELDNPQDSKEITAEKRQATIKNIAQGGNKARKPNMRWSDKLNLKN